MRGLWVPSPELAPGDLSAALERALRDRTTETLKQEKQVLVLRAALYGRPVVIKRYQPGSARRRMKDFPRPSRARKAWAAAYAMEQLGLPAAQPLGYLERRVHGLPAGSTFIMRALPAASDLRHYLNPVYACLSCTERAAWRRRLLDALDMLYRHGIVHGDTKASNLLVTPDRDGVPVLQWIDFECVRFGRPASTRAVLRNLVQMNGSLADTVPARERLAFLYAIRKACPGLLPRDAARRIARRTRQRLRRQDRRGINP